jgi:precorrin-6A/cobalt-precorrin-6A reductase
MSQNSSIQNPKSKIQNRPIWLIGGTQESAQLARAIAQLGLPCMISVTTESARTLYPQAPQLKVWVGKLDSDQVKMFLREHSVSAVLDASHPFAIEISQLAIVATTELGIPYLRYERSANFADQPAATTSVASFDNLLENHLLQGRRVLLTIGYRPLHLFRPWQNKATLFARILPSPIALQTALEAGFTNDRLIALRPPISFELERALWRQWNLSLVVAKASGAPGGEEIKRQVAADLGVELVMVDRPLVTYPQQTSDLQTAIAFCLKNK